MNSSGIFNDKFSPVGAGLFGGKDVVFGTIAHPTHAPADAIVVADPQLLFHGSFKRAGVDLILSKDGHELLVPDYFRGEKRAALSSPDGAHLTGAIVEALTGHTQYAQAGGSSGPGTVIGHVTKLAGTATVTRNGVAILLHLGDNVEKGDVVASGSDSTLGITFIDGTVFGLSSNARMVLNDMIYDPNGSNNSSLLSLVAGTISFVAGQTAKHGDMKVDTPVATMGIRGTAVLVEIDFSVPGQGSLPAAHFQVLVEPDGTTGSYTLYDKTTLAPIATVNQAGQQINISQGQVSVTNAPLSTDEQKLITDVFTLKFTDNNNPNPKTTTAQNSSITPQTLNPIKLADGATATPIVVNVNTVQQPVTTGSTSGSGFHPTDTNNVIPHINLPPSLVVNGALLAHAGMAGPGAIDTVSNKINFVDPNAGDTPTVAIQFSSFSYQNAAHQDITGSLTPLQQADIAAAEASLVVVPAAGNNNNGSATWTYSIPDSALGFLGAGETLNLTYLATVNNNYAPDPQTAVAPFTITVTGSNAAPVITSGGQSAGITESVVPNLATPDTASGTVTFTDANLSDTHHVTVTGLTMSGVTTGLNATTALGWLTLTEQSDSSNGATGSEAWTFSAADKNFDYLAAGEKLNLTYTLQVDDGQGGVVTTPVTVTVTGTNDTPVLAAGSITSGTINIPLAAAASNTVSPDLAAHLAAPGLVGDLAGQSGYGTLALSPGDDNSSAPIDITSVFGAAGVDFFGTSYTSLYVNNNGNITFGAPLGAFTPSAIGAGFSYPIIAPFWADVFTAGTGGGAVYTDLDAADGVMTITWDQVGYYYYGTDKLDSFQLVLINEGHGNFDIEYRYGNIQWTTGDASGGSDGLGGAVARAGYSAGDGVHAYELPQSGNQDAMLALPSTPGNTGVDGVDTFAVSNGEVGTSPLTSTGTINFSDADLSDTHTIQSVTYTGGGTELGTLSLTELSDTTGVGTGGQFVWTYTADPTAVITALNGIASHSKVETFDVVISDGHGGTLDQTVTVNLNETGDHQPVITSSSQTASITEIPGAMNSSTTDTASGAVTFTDADLTDSHTVTLTEVTASGVTAGLPTDNTTLLGWLTLTQQSDSTGGVTGSDAWTFSAADKVFDYLAAGEQLILTYTVQVDDGHGGIATTPVTITVTGTNDAPVITSAAQSAGITESAVPNLATPDTASGTVMFTDLDLSDTHSVTVTSVSASGVTTGLNATTALAWLTLTQQSDSTNGATGSEAWTFSAADKNFDYLAAGQQLVLTYTVQVSDGHDGIVNTPVTITVTGTNDAPVITSAAQSAAITESAVANLATPDVASGTVTFTDLDLSDTHTVTVTGVTASGVTTGLNTTTALGWLTLTQQSDSTNGATGSDTWTFSAADKSFDYLAAGQQLILTYTLQVDDGHGGVVTTPITITVTGTNDAPVITSAAQSADITESSVPNLATPDVASGAVTFTDLDLSDTHVVTVTGVTASGVTTGLNAATALGWLTLTTQSDSTNGATGSDAWTFSAADKSFDYLAAGQQLVLTYTVQVDDGHGGIVTTPVTITVTGTNDAPVITSAAQSAAITESAVPNLATPDVASGAITFTDLDLSDTHTFTVTGVTASGVTSGLNAATALGWLTLTAQSDSTNGATGSDAWTFSAADKSFDYLAAGQQLVLTYTVQVDDGHGGVVTTPVTITVTGTNDAPVITSAAQSAAITVSSVPNLATPDVASGAVTFTDLDLSDTHSMTVTGVTASGVTSGLNSAELSSWLTLTKQSDSTGGVSGTEAWTFSAADNNFDYLATGEQLVLTYTVQVDDGHGGIVTTPVTITVTASNDAPPVITSGTQSAAITEQAVPNLSTPDNASGAVTFTDANLSDTHSVTVTGVTASGVTSGLNSAELLSWLTLTKQSDSTGGVSGTEAWTFSAADKSFDYLAAGQQLVLTYTVQVDDGHGGVVTTPVTITVTGTNDAPVITSAAQAAAITESAGPNLSTPDIASGAVTFTDLDLSDTHSVTVTGVTASGVTTGLNTATALGWLTLTQQSDSTNGATGSEAWTFSAADKSFDYLAAGQQLVLTYTLQVDDGHGGIVTTPITITVTGTNDAPVITSAAQSAAITESAVPNLATPDVASGAITFTDLDLSDTHVVTVTGVTASGVTTGLNATTALGWLTLTQQSDSTNGATGSEAWTFSAADKSFDYLAAGQQLVLTYTVQVDDGHGGIVTTPVTITVTGTNDAPVIHAPTTADPGPIKLPAGTPDGEGGYIPVVSSNDFNFSDPDLSDAHTVSYTFDSSLSNLGGLLTAPIGEFAAALVQDSIGGNSGDVHWTFTLNSGDLTALDTTNLLPAGAKIVEVFDVTVDDGHGGTATRDVSIEIDAPTGPTEPFVWASDASGSWTDPTGWQNVGLVPGANDLVQINYSDITVTVGSTVTVDTLASAATLDIASNGGLTISDAGGNSTNTGTIDIYGTLTLDGGTLDGNPTGQQAGSIAVEFNGKMTVNGATVSGAALTIGNAGESGDSLPAATLLLDDGAAISGGTLTINVYAMLDIEYGGSGPGATLDSVTVTNDGTIAVDLNALAAVLTFDDGTTISAGTLDIASQGKLDIERGASGPGATLDDVTVSNSGIVQVDAAFTSTSIFKLEDGTAIDGGALTIGSGSTLEIAYGANGLGATLDAVSVSNSGQIQIDSIVQDPTLTLQDGTTITGSTLSIGSGDTLAIGPSPINTPGATLDNVTVIAADPSSNITLTADSALVLNGATITGATINSAGLSSDIDVTGSSTINGGASLNNGYVSVESGQTLTLDNVMVAGTLFNLYGFGDTLKITQPSSFNGTIGGLANGDAIDLTTLSYSSDDYSVWTQTATSNGGAGTLQIYSGGALQATLNLSGIYSQGDFVLADDQNASHGTDVNIVDVNINHVSFYSGTINSVYSGTNNTIVAYTPQISLGASTLQLTDGNGGEAASWFASTPYSIASFTASFDYQAIVGSDPADGLAFILQNSAAGIHALGAGGGDLGYGGGSSITPSAAVEFNLYSSYGQGTAFETNGLTGIAGSIYQSTGNVAFWNGDAMHVVVSYDGSVLTESLTDLVNGATYTAQYSVDLASILQGSTATIGFSAATGEAFSTQTISNFTFTNGSNGAPVVSLPETAPSISVDQATTLSGISLSESGTTSGEIFTVKLSDSYGQLSTTAVGDGDTVTVTAGTELTITGSLSDINSDLSRLTDTNPQIGPDPITVTATDSLGQSAVPQSLAVTVTSPVVIGPVVSGAGTTALYAGTPVILDPGIAVADAATTIASVTVSISSGFQTGDQLMIDGLLDGNYSASEASPNLLHFHYDSTTQAMVLSVAAGTPTAADFNAALQAIQYATTGNDPTAEGTDTSRTITWTAQDSGDQSSAAATTTVSLAAIDEWINPSSGNWFVAANWSNGLPTATTDALIGVPVTVTLDNSGTPAFALLDVKAGATLLVQNTGVNSVGGVISADGGSVDLQSATITGGTLQSSNGGAFYAVNNASTLDGTGGNTITNLATIEVDDNQHLLLQGAIDNVGTIALASAGNGTFLEINAAGGAGATLSGGGLVTMTDSAANVIQGRDGGSAGTDLLTNLDNSIEGAGTIGGNGLGLVNDGLIDATGSNALIIDTAGDTVLNNSTLEASGAGGLHINSTTINNTNGVINAAGGNVDLQGATISGGKLQASNGGAFHAVNNASTLDGTGGNTITIASTATVQVDDNQHLLLQGTIDNAGTIALASAGNGTYLEINAVGGAGATLSGGGFVTMSDSTANVIQGRDGGNAGTDLLTNLNNTIKGAGTIGGNGLALVNDGLIDATGSNALIIDTAGDTVINNSMLEAAGAGGLRMIGTTVNNINGVIAAAGGNVDLQSATLIGGKLEASNGGIFHAVDNASTLDGTGGNTITIASTATVQVDDNQHLLLQGAIDNAGTIALASGGNNGTYLEINSAGGVGATLSGGGFVTMTDSAANAIQGRDGGNAGTDLLTNLDNTIEGAGRIGDNGLGLINDCVIDATGANNALILDFQGSSIRNTGTLEATGVGGLLIRNTSVNDVGGAISAAGGNVDLQSATLTGGTLEASGAGKFHAINNASTLDGTGGNTITIASSATVQVDDNQHLLLQGAIDNAGTIALASGGNNGTYLEINAAGGVGATLSGGGLVTMTDSTANVIQGRDGGSAGTDLLTNLDNTIEGAGTIGGDGLGLVNDGLIDATGSNALILDTEGDTVINNSTLEASGTGGLHIISTTVNNINGVIDAAGGNVDLQSATISGGALEASNGGTFHAVNNASTLDGTGGNTITIASAATVQVDDNQHLLLQGAIDNAGTIALASGGNNGTYLEINANGGLGATLSGGGLVTMSDSAANIIQGRDGGNAGTDLLTNLNNSIEGAGRIGDNGLGLVNDGLIDATGVNNALIIDFQNSSIVNAGTLEATAVGGLLIRSTTINNVGGAIKAAGGNVDLQSATISGGTLEASNGGIFHAVNNASTLDGTGGHTITIAGTATVQVDDNQHLLLQGAIDNAGTIALASGGNNGTYLETNAAGGVGATLSGGGLITMTDSAANVIQGRDGGSAGTDLLTNLDNSIEGAGTIGGNGLALVNDGVIDATGVNNALIIDFQGSSILNAGTLEATGVAGLLIRNTTVNNVGGVIETAGGDVDLQSITISSGTLTTFASGTSAIVVTGSSTINGGAALYGANVTINGGQTLTLDNVTAIGTSFNDTATGSLIQVDSNDTLVLSGVTVTGGSFTNAGDVYAEGITTLATADPISNSGLLVVTGGATLDAQASEIDDTGTGSADGLVIGNAAVLRVDNSSGLKLAGHGAVVLDAGSDITENTGNPDVVSSGAVLALDNVDNFIFGSGEIGSGTVPDGEAVIGSLDLINAAAGIIEASGGTLTVNTGNAITNSGLLEASAGSKLVVDDAVIGTGSETIAAGAVMTFMSSVAATQTVTFAGAGKLYLAQPAAFNGSIAGLSGSDLLDLAGFDPATTAVSVGGYANGVTVLTVTDASHTVNLRLVGDYHAAGFTSVSDVNGGVLLIYNPEAPIAVTATSNRNDSATTSQVYQADGAIISSTTGSGLFISNADSNAADLIIAELDQATTINVSGGTGYSGFATNNASSSSAASVAVFSAAAISASGSGDIGIAAIANNNVTVDDSGNVSGARFGIFVQEASASVVANVDVNVAPNATIASTIISTSQGYNGDGIRALNSGAGDISVRTSSGDQINSVGSGIDAINQATLAAASDNSTILVTAFGTIHSGSVDTGSGNLPAGILAGYFGSNGSSEPTIYPVPGLYGDVIVNNSAEITADAGDGIRAFDYGIGDITVNDLAGTILASGGPNPAAGSGVGIAAYNYGTGNIEIYTAPGTAIDSGGAGIHANNSDTTVPASSEIVIVAYGTITPGTVVNSNGTPAAGILAGYDSNGLAEDNVQGNVTIDDHASINAATGTDAIRGYNYGTGTITITVEADAVLDGPRYGVGGFGHDGGNVTVVNDGSVTGGTDAIDATTTGTGTVTIVNDGHLIGEVGGYNATFTNVGDWSMSGTSTFTGASTLANDGTIESQATSLLSGLSGIVNHGAIEVVNGSLKLDAAVSGTGSLTVDAGASLELTSTVSAGQTVKFGGTTGIVVLDQAQNFHGTVAGLGTTDGAPADSDQIDLANINFNSTNFSEQFNAVTDTLSVSDGANAAVIQLEGSYSSANFNFVSDGKPINGVAGSSGTIVYDPPAASPVNGSFVFAPTISGPPAQHVIADFVDGLDKIDVRQFANITAAALPIAVQQGSDTLVTLDSHDMVWLKNFTASQLHASDFILHA